MYKNIDIINCILRFNIRSIWVHICTGIQDPMTRAISGLPSTSHLQSLFTLCLRKRSFLKRKFLTQCPCYPISTSLVISFLSCKIRTNPDVNINLNVLTQQQLVHCSRTFLFTIPSVLPVVEKLHVALDKFCVVVELWVVDGLGVDGYVVLPDTVIPKYKYI